MPFGDDQQPVGAFSADGADPAFRDRVRLRGLRWCAYHVDTGPSEDSVEGSRELRIAVTEKESEPVAALLEIHQQVPCLLGYPRRGWMLRDPEDVDTAGGVFDDEEHVDPLEERGVHRGEITGQQARGLGA
nr:hypothetical protein [Parafrankia colletiae]